MNTLAQSVEIHLNLKASQTIWNQACHSLEMVSWWYVFNIKTLRGTNWKLTKRTTLHSSECTQNFFSPPCTFCDLQITPEGEGIINYSSDPLLILQYNSVPAKRRKNKTYRYKIFGLGPGHIWSRDGQSSPGPSGTKFISLTGTKIFSEQNQDQNVLFGPGP